MRGFLSFIILWLISKEPMTGADIALELEKRRGSKPSPGTVYPALKELKDKQLLQMNEGKQYTLTARGRKELQVALKFFFSTFPDIDEMRTCT